MTLYLSFNIISKIESSDVYAKFFIKLRVMNDIGDLFNKTIITHNRLQVHEKLPWGRFPQAGSLPSVATNIIVSTSAS